ncbi:cupin domain-containing protein [Candidatus Aerophobetes bacterium]|nr:cupin domain-containing protein [Candidatus Aerophobetes bacterium]
MYKINIEDMPADTCKRSFRYFAKEKKGETLRDTYWLITSDNSPSRNLKMGYTIIYPEGKTTGHSHEEMEEVYFVISGKGKMVIGDEEFCVKEGDAFYVPPGPYHVTYNTGLLPLSFLWVTGKLDLKLKDNKKEK